MRKTFFSMGHSLVTHIDLQEVRGLIGSLRPLDCGKKLVRIGGPGDGGYLLPDDLEGIAFCFSPGVSTVANFENEIADLGIQSFLADYSVSAPPIDRPEFTFLRKFLGSTEDEQFTTLSGWKQKYLGNYSGDLLLQMDIEGSEYEVLLNTPDELLDQFRIIIIEFHWFDRVFDPFGFRLYKACFRKLLKHFDVAHIHPNNCRPLLRRGDVEVPEVMEITFYNKRRSTPVGVVQQFPHSLDHDNLPGEEPIALPRCWYHP